MSSEMSFGDELFAEKLQNMDSTQEGVQRIAEWIMFHDKPEETARMWKDSILKCSQNRKLLYLYLANDILQNSRKQEGVGNKYIHEFGNILVDVIRDIYPKLSSKDQSKLERLLNIWEQRTVYTTHYIRKIKKKIEKTKKKAKKEKSKKKDKDKEKEKEKEREKEKEEKMKLQVPDDLKEVVQLLHSLDDPDLSPNTDEKAQIALAYFKDVSNDELCNFSTIAPADLADHQTSLVAQRERFTTILRKKNLIIEHYKQLINSEEQEIKELQSDMAGTEKAVGVVDSLMALQTEIVSEHVSDGPPLKKQKRGDGDGYTYAKDFNEDDFPDLDQFNDIYEANYAPPSVKAAQQQTHELTKDADLSNTQNILASSSGLNVPVASNLSNFGTQNSFGSSALGVGSSSIGVGSSSIGVGSSALVGSSGGPSSTRTRSVEMYTGAGTFSSVHGASKSENWTNESGWNPARQYVTGR